MEAQTIQDTAEKIAPLLDDQGVLVVHFDLRKIDLDAWSDRLTGFFDKSLPEFGFDAKSLRGIMDEWKKLTVKKLPEFKEAVDRFVKECGVGEVFLVSCLREDLDMVPPFLAVPLQGKNEDQKRRLRKELEMLNPYEDPLPLVEVRGFLMLPVSDPDSLSEDDADALKDYFSDFQAKPRTPLAEGWKSHENALVKGIILPPKNLDELIVNLDPNWSDDEFFIQTKELIGKKTKSLSFGFDMDEMCLTVRLAMEDGDSAADLHEKLKTVLTLATMEVERKTSQNDVLKFMARLITVSFEEVARQVFPTRDGDALVVRVDSSNCMLYYSFLAHLVFLSDDVNNK